MRKYIFIISCQKIYTYAIIHDDETTKVTKDDIFKEDIYHLKEIANKF